MTSNASGVCATLAATLILGGITLSAAAVCKCRPSSEEITDIKWKKHGFTYYGEDGIRHKVKFK